MYREDEIQLQKGSKLFLYTDGVAEAANAENELFGTERMLKALNKNPDTAPKQVLQNVSEDINAFLPVLNSLTRSPCSVSSITVLSRTENTRDPTNPPRRRDVRHGNFRVQGKWLKQTEKVFSKKD